MDLWFTIFRKALDFQPKIYLAALIRKVLPNPQDYINLSQCSHYAHTGLQVYSFTKSGNPSRSFLPDYLGVSGKTAGSLNGSAYLLHIECC